MYYTTYVTIEEFDLWVFFKPSADADIGLVLTLQWTDLQSTNSLSLSSSYKPYHLSNHCSPTTFIVTH